MPEISTPIVMRRRAVLIFADSIAADLSRRGFPNGASALLRHPAAQLENSVEYDVHLFSRAFLPGDAGGKFHLQRGASFAARLENAIERLSALGYEEIVAIGRDCPDLRPEDIALAFERLTPCKLVLGPDHRGGCYLIGFRVVDRSLLHGIQWNRNTDCAQLCSRTDEVAVAFLEVKQDVDTWSDLHLLAQAADACGRLVRFLLLQIDPSSSQSRVAPLVIESWQAELARRQLPPPRAA